MASEEQHSKVGSIMSDYRQVKFNLTARLSPYCSIVGDVTVGAYVSVFAGSHIRGDGAPIVIGDGSNIQENCCLHVSGGFPLTIGKDVTVGHGAILHGCTIDDNVLIGMGAIVMDGAHIPSNCLVAAGALVTQGKEFPEYSLIMGSPAQAVRTLTPEELEAQVTLAAPDYRAVADAMLASGLMSNPPLGVYVWPAPRMTDNLAAGGMIAGGLF